MRDVRDIETHEVFTGEIVQSWADDSALVDGKPDFSLVEPVLFEMYGPGYWSLGERIGRPWHEGKQHAAPQK